MPADAASSAQTSGDFPSPRVAAAMCLAGLLLIYAPTFSAGLDRILAGADDFLGLYAGAHLVGTHDLYNAAVVRQTQLRYAHVTGPSLLYSRIPCFALFLWPLGRLPYGVAHGIWCALRFLAVIGFVLLWPHGARRVAAVICCWSLPLAAALANGQDVPLLLVALALWQRLEQRGLPFWAGVALACCAAKYHLFLPLPLLLVVHRRWATLKGLVSAGTALAALSFLAGGWDWPVRYWRVLADPAIHPQRGTMPNLHGLLGLDSAALFAVAAAVMLALVFWMRRAAWLPAIAIALFGGLLLSYHSYVADAAILIPATLLVLALPAARVVRIVTLLLATPLPWLLLLGRG